MNNFLERRQLEQLFKILIALGFALAFIQSPLYSSNQNTYFLHGLANAGLGALSQDWLSQTTDPFPVFSALVKWTVIIFDDFFFYYYNVLLLAIFCYCILGIASYVFNIENVGVKYISFALVLTALYSGAAWYVLSKVPHIQYYAGLIHPRGALVSGVAGQYILGPIFQPSVFGVLLVASIYNFLKDRYLLSAFLVAVAIFFHSSYLLSGAFLILAYCLIVWSRQKTIRSVFYLAAFAAILIMPVILFLYANFQPTNGDLHAQATRILVDYRIPHHARIERWFTTTAILQVAIVLLGIAVARNTRVAPIMLVAFSGALLLTLGQFVTGSATIALMFPWRASVLLVPMASALLIFFVVNLACKALPWLSGKRAGLVYLALLITVVGLGASKNYFQLSRGHIGVGEVTSYITKNHRYGNVYLVPVDNETFRLAALAPIFVDFKSHPYKDEEVVEWYQRVLLAKSFFGSQGDAQCEVLSRILEQNEVTHVVMPISEPPPICEGMEKLASDEALALFSIQ